MDTIFEVALSDLLESSLSIKLSDFLFGQISEFLEEVLSFCKNILGKVKGKDRPWQPEAFEFSDAYTIFILTYQINYSFQMLRYYKFKVQTAKWCLLNLKNIANEILNFSILYDNFNQE